MSNAMEKLLAAQQHAATYRPKVGGFPYLAECLRQTGMESNTWELPSCQSIYVMNGSSIVNQGTPLLTGMSEVPVFNRDALITALRTNQAGKSTFPEFLEAAWKAGVVRYRVDFAQHIVIYYGAKNESYEESYPAADVEAFL